MLRFSAAANDAVDSSHTDSFIPQGLLKLLISGEPQARELFGIIYDDFPGKRPVQAARGPKTRCSGRAVVAVAVNRCRQ